MKTHTRIALVLALTLPVAAFASSSTDSKIEDAAKASYNYRTVLEDRVTVKSNDGVVSVNNRIEVKSDFPEHSDAWIAFKIHSELLLKANVSATATRVDVKDGIVTLTGKAINNAQKDLTEAYVKDIDNVKAVRNEMVVEAPATASATVGEVIDDASITSEVKYALLSHRSTSAISTKVTTNDSVVVISGVAGSDAEKDLVTKLAQDARGVKSVVNNMTVKS
jgi:osmotically-inducible protein OsmY